MVVKFSLVGIATRDMAASLRFYRLLDLAIPDGQDGEGHVEIDLGGGVRFAWDTVAILEDVYGEWVAEPLGQRVELAFDCATRGEVDATYATIVGAGYRGHRAPWDAVWGQRYAIVEDPDGNLVSLFAGGERRGGVGAVPHPRRCCGSPLRRPGGTRPSEERRKRYTANIRKTRRGAVQTLDSARACTRAGPKPADAR